MFIVPQFGVQSSQWRQPRGTHARVFSFSWKVNEDGQNVGTAALCCPRESRAPPQTHLASVIESGRRSRSSTRVRNRRGFTRNSAAEAPECDRKWAWSANTRLGNQLPSPESGVRNWKMNNTASRDATCQAPRSREVEVGPPRHNISQLGREMNPSTVQSGC